MKKISLLILLGFIVASCNQQPKPVITTMQGNKEACCDSVRDGVLIHITESYNDPHRVLMPLKMAVMMAKDKDVLIYMDIHAVELAVKGAKDMKFANFESFQSYVKQLVKLKVGIYACPTCLKIAGFKSTDLLNGVQVAQKDKFFNFTKGRIITLDY
jgi:predicted peroxiredoxin